MGKFTFRKEERLSKEKHIQELFGKGSSFYLFPFKVFFLPQAEPASAFHQVLMTVSKKNFKNAVDRNLIKRRMREAYRLHKAGLPLAPKLWIGYVYSHGEIMAQADMASKMQQVFRRLARQMPPNPAA